MPNKPNWDNRTIFTGDNLDVMRGMNSATVDVIYADPPFNSNKNYEAPITYGSWFTERMRKKYGKKKDRIIAAFTDTWTLTEENKEWHKGLEVKNKPLWDRY